MKPRTVRSILIANGVYAKVEAPPTAPKVTLVKREWPQNFVIFGGLNGQVLLEELERGARGE